MSKKQNGVNYSKAEKVVRRRENTIVRLESQLELGKKRLSARKAKEYGVAKLTIELEPEDVVRIEKEIRTLKSRL